MGPEFNEKMQWARYLQLQHDEERRQERARMARIEEELRKEKENKDIEEKYMNYEVKDETEERVKETKNNKEPWIFALVGVLFWAIVTWIIVALGG